MRFFCPGCGARQEKPDDEIPKAGLSIPCEKCGFGITLKPPASRAVRIKEEPATPPGDLDVTDKSEQAGPPPAEVERTDIEEPLPEQPEVTKKEKPPQKEKPPRPKRKPFYLGTGRSGEGYRFRDLVYALLVPLDSRKPLVVGLFLFVGNLMFAGLSYLGLLTRSQIGLTVGAVIGGLVLWAALMLALGVTSQQTHLEMELGRRLPMAEGVRFVLSRPLSVLGTPFVFLAVILGLVAVLAVISLLGRIPYAGPILYGLTFLGTFAVALAAVLCGVLMNLVTFSYIPAMASEELGAWDCAKRMLGLIRRHPGSYLLHVLVAGACAFGLLLVIRYLLGLSMPLIGWTGGKLMGPQFSATLIAVPGGLFCVLYFVLPEGMQAWLQASAGSGWWYSLGGWLVALSLLMVLSVAFAHVLTYFYAAGVVSYRLLLKKEADQPGGQES